MFIPGQNKVQIGNSSWT